MAEAHISVNEALTEKEHNLTRHRSSQRPVRRRAHFMHNAAPDEQATLPPSHCGRDEIEAAVYAAIVGDAVKVIVVRGAGRSFCGGYEFGGGFEQWDKYVKTDGVWDPGKDFIYATAPAVAPTQKFLSFWRSPKPVIAQVHGYCGGGGSDDALCADLVIASEDACIGTPYSRMWGSYLSGMWIYRLGSTKAKEHGLTGKPLSGKRAAEVGLIDSAVPLPSSRLRYGVKRSSLRRSRFRSSPR